MDRAECSAAAAAAAGKCSEHACYHFAIDSTDSGHSAVASVVGAAEEDVFAAAECCSEPACCQAVTDLERTAVVASNVGAAEGPLIPAVE